MKKVQKMRRISGFLLACMMICLPAAQVLAETSYDAVTLFDAQILFPGDSLINVNTAVMLDGQPIELNAETPTTWTNQEDGKVYGASLAEDGTLQLSLAGYVLVIKGGTSSAEDEFGSIGGHAQFQEETEEKQDVAYYPVGTVVQIQAGEAVEGMEFSGWTTENDGVVFQDAASSDTTVTLPETKVTITANYQPKPQEPEMQDVPEEQGGSDEYFMPEEQGGSDEYYTPDVQDDPDMDGAVDDQIPQGSDGDVVWNNQNDPGVDWDVPGENQNIPDIDGSIIIEGQDMVGDENTDIDQNLDWQSFPEDGDSEIQDEPEEPILPIVNSVTVYDGNGENAYEVGNYEAGETVSISAYDYAEANYEFNGWSVDSFNAELSDLSAAEVTFTMPEAPVVLTAHYAAAQTSTPDGTIQNGVTPVDAVQSGMPQSETVQSETPQSETTQPETVQLETPQSETVQPETHQPEIVQSEAPQSEAPQTPETYASYSVKVVNGVITDGATIVTKGVYAENTQITLEANAPQTGMKFARWSATAVDTGEELADTVFSDANSETTIFTVPAKNVKVKAKYKTIKYNVTINDGASDYTKAESGTVVTITANAAPEGMEFDYWSVASGNVSLKNAYSETTTFTMPMANVTVSANYKLKEYHLTVENGYGNKEYYHMGDTVTVYSNYPASGKEFSQWETTNANVVFDAVSRWTTTFTMPPSDVSVRAAYKDGPSPNNNQILELAEGGEYITDSTIKFTASGAGMDNTNPNPGDYRYRPTGYQIGNVTGTWQASPYTTSMSIKAAGEYTLKVTYNKEVFDGNNWVSDGTTDAKSVTFRVIIPAAAVATGDETPIMMIAAVAGVSCLLFILLLIIFIKRRKNRK